MKKYILIFSLIGIVAMEGCQTPQQTSSEKFETELDLINKNYEGLQSSTDKDAKDLTEIKDALIELESNFANDTLLDTIQIISWFEAFERINPSLSYTNLSETEETLDKEISANTLNTFFHDQPFTSKDLKHNGQYKVIYENLPSFYGTSINYKNKNTVTQLDSIPLNFPIENDKAAVVFIKEKTTSHFKWWHPQLTAHTHSPCKTTGTISANHPTVKVKYDDGKKEDVALIRTIKSASNGGGQCKYNYNNKLTKVRVVKFDYNGTTYKFAYTPKSYTGKF